MAAPQKFTEPKPLGFDDDEDRPPRRLRPDRADKQIIAGHFKHDTAFSLQELLARVSRKTNRKVTVQQAIAAGLALFFLAHDAQPPEELQRLAAEVPEPPPEPPKPPGRRTRPAADKTLHPPPAKPVRRRPTPLDL
jgi:hypothetical protein